MLDRLTPSQLVVVQKIFIENTMRDGIGFTPVANAKECEECSHCLGGDDTCISGPAHHECRLCSSVVEFDMTGDGKCNNSKCKEVSNFYGINAITIRRNSGFFGSDIKTSMKKKHKENRYRTAKFFKKDNKQYFNDLTFDELYFGIDLEIKTELNKVIKQLREVVKDGIT